MTMKEELVRAYWQVVRVQDGESFQIGVEWEKLEDAQWYLDTVALRCGRKAGTEFRIYRYEVTRSLVL